VWLALKNLNEEIGVNGFYVMISQGTGRFGHWSLIGEAFKRSTRIKI